MSVSKEMTEAVVLQSKEINNSKGLPEFDLNFFALELCGEVGEFANIVKKIWRDGDSMEYQTKLRDELADVQILVDRIAAGANIDLENEVRMKLYRNRKRFNLPE